ncbi:MAG: DnaD domain protein [Clostridia bacterium]
MPTFETDKAAILWDATAIPNAFFCEYMPSAPDGYAKVYLYCLMRAHAGQLEDDAMLDDVALALHISRDEVEQALRYWERCRLVAHVKERPPVYRFLSVQQAFFNRQSAPDDKAYESFAQALYAAFGAKRKLHGGESVLAYEWVEQLKLPPEVVLMLIQHLIATRGVQFSFKEAQKLATEMSEQQVTTMETAEAFFSRSEAAWKGARRILTHLGKRRNPSMDEIDLYVKWTATWGFAPKAIETACTETTKGDPSFGYLDRILQGINDRSGGRATSSAAQVERQLAGEKDESTRVREMLSAFGMKAPVVDEGKRLVYRDMLTYAEHEVVKRRGVHSLEDVTALLSAWREKGLKDASAVNAHLRLVEEQNKRLRALGALAGRESGSCTQPNRELLLKWTEQWRLPSALLDSAAECSYMDKLLSSWFGANALNVEAARAEHERHAQAFASKPAQGSVKKVIEQQYSQRDYDPAEYDGLTPEQLEEVRKL